MGSTKWSRGYFQNCPPLGADGTRVTASDAHIALSRRIATEGMVLLENRGRVLPFPAGRKIALFGIGQILSIKGGGGSGDVYTPYVRNFYDGLKIKEDEGKIQLFHPLSDYMAGQAKEWDSKNAEEPAVPDALMQEAAAFTDTAVCVLRRFSTEGEDRRDFDLSESENALLAAIGKAFPKVVVLLNIGAVINIRSVLKAPSVQGVLLAWQGGMEGGLAAADVLCGDVNPSGRLVDTFAETLDDYPSTRTFHESLDYVRYTEDIYVGYRYFETIPGADKRVVYPFGYGLSYTEFTVSGAAARQDGDAIIVECDVKNVGAVAGKEVVQVYFGAPQGKLGKAARSLACYRKTKLLAPGETQHLVMSYKIADMASYDDTGKVCKSAYILEQGEYALYLGTSVRDTVKLAYAYRVEKPYELVEQLKERCAPTMLKERLLADGTTEPVADRAPICLYPQKKQVSIAKQVKPEKPIMLIDVAEKRATLDDFLAQLSDRELTQLTGKPEGNPNAGVSNTFGVGNLEAYGVPNARTADGPQGLRLFECTGTYTTAWPVATLIACTWDPELAEEMGRAAAMELKENNLDIWLAPALNIHRSPLCGRNFEYYSEDPLISGTFAAACVRGVQSQGIAATIKHFCCNNKEDNRMFSDSIVSERALREIYLKGFEIAVKTAQPWLLMSSYNLLNGLFTSTSYELLTGILREEWGYQGAVTSDWGNSALEVFEVKAGNDIKMPFGYPQALQEAVEFNNLRREDLLNVARHIMELLLKLGD